MVRKSAKFVSYIRVSTARQGKSGLGLEAQQEAVSAHLEACGGKLVAEFREVESGKRSDRPELQKALATCRRHGATLLVAKLDRLARNVAFLSGLMESGVEFVACDFPSANKLTVHILAAVAEHEAAAISARTKAALAAARRRGVRLGNPGGWQAGGQRKGSKAGNAAKAKLADARAADIAPVIDEVRVAGAASLREIAAALNERGEPAPRGGQWSAATVQRTLARLDEA